MVTRLLALFTFFAAAANAQITLTADNATPPRGYTDSLYLGSTAGLSAPTTGPAQVWDYSGIEDGALRVVDVLDVSENTFLPAASSTSPGSLRFQVFAAESDFYDGADADGLERSRPVVRLLPQADVFVEANASIEEIIDQGELALFVQTASGFDQFEPVEHIASGRWAVALFRQAYDTSQIGRHRARQQRTADQQPEQSAPAPMTAASVLSLGR